LLVKIHAETTVSAPITKVWRDYTIPDGIMIWNAECDDWRAPCATLVLRKGGTFSDTSMGFDFAGTHTRLIEHKLIEYSLGDRTAQVTFDDGPSGVTVGVTFNNEETHSIEQQRDGWQSILKNFKKYVNRPTPGRWSPQE
jgi:uncharacterized protein YndB with AHSA1/START domain